jgi:predicted nuclease of predicted toxin-antitoxin system
MRALLDHNLPARLLAVVRSWPWVTQTEHVADLGWADADDLSFGKRPPHNPP